MIPMAGKGKSRRPHTPLIPTAAKPIKQRLVEDIAAVTPEKMEKIGFVIRSFGNEESLIQNNSKLEGVNFANSMIGNFVNLKGNPKSVSLGDYSEW